MAQRFQCRFSSVLTGALLLTGMGLAMPDARAFTIEDGSGKGQIPKFDLEEQARQFRKGDLNTSSSGTREWDTSVGKFQFNVQTNSPFGSNSAASDRQYFNRMLEPPQMRDR